jgi:hypothetical protein
LLRLGFRTSAEIRVSASQRLGLVRREIRVQTRQRLGFSASTEIRVRALAEIRVQGVGRD